MNHHILIVCSIFLCLSTIARGEPTKQYDIIVVGAGPAGISSIGSLLDYKNTKNILWVDPEFNIGRIKNYAHVPSNTPVRLFLKYFTSCKSFKNKALDEALKPMKELDQTKWCNLGYLFEPLQLVTDHLKAHVNSIKGSVTHVQQNKKNGWLLEIDKKEIVSGKRVILATGSCPKRLTLNGPLEIPLDDVFDPSALEKWIQPDDTVAIFGNAHSGILAIKNVSAFPIKHIYNFCKTPLLYATRHEGKIINNSKGITSATAEWARNNLEKRYPANITVLDSTQENIDQYIGLCNKVIYAIGFEQNKISGIHKNDCECEYDQSTGFIAPGLFGIGIAFPEGYNDDANRWQHRVGINSFMRFAKKMVPHWLKN